MEKLEVILNRDVLKNEKKQLQRDLKKGEVMDFHLGKDLITVSDNFAFLNEKGNKRLLELPLTYFNIPFNQNEYSTFMTEISDEQVILFCMKPPFNRMDVLTAIQNAETDPLADSEVLKISISSTATADLSLIVLKDIKPLF